MIQCFTSMLRLMTKMMLWRRRTVVYILSCCFGDEMSLFLMVYTIFSCGFRFHFCLKFVMKCLQCSVTCYGIISYHIISYHIISYHIISYHITSFRIIIYRIISYRFISYHIMSYHTISYHIISYHIISYHIINY